MTAFPPAPLPSKGVTIGRGLRPLHATDCSFSGRPSEGTHHA
jgi:hypothetical protein